MFISHNISNILTITGLDIKNFRKEFDLTQEEFAVDLGVSYRTVQNYERDGVIPKSKMPLIKSVMDKRRSSSAGDDDATISLVNEPIPVYSDEKILAYVNAIKEGNLDNVNDLELELTKLIHERDTLRAKLKVIIDLVER